MLSNDARLDDEHTEGITPYCTIIIWLCFSRILPAIAISPALSKCDFQNSQNVSTEGTLLCDLRIEDSTNCLLRGPKMSLSRLQSTAWSPNSAIMNYWKLSFLKPLFNFLIACVFHTTPHCQDTAGPRVSTYFGDIRSDEDTNPMGTHVIQPPEAGSTCAQQPSSRRSISCRQMLMRDLFVSTCNVSRNRACFQLATVSSQTPASTHLHKYYTSFMAEAVGPPQKQFGSLMFLTRRTWCRVSDLHLYSRVETKFYARS